MLLLESHPPCLSKAETHIVLELSQLSQTCRPVSPRVHHLLSVLFVTLNYPSRAIYYSKMFSVVLIKHLAPKQLRPRRELCWLDFHIRVHYWRKSEQELKKDPTGRNWNRGHEGILLTGLLSVTAQLVFLYNSRLPAQGWHCAQWTGPSYVNH